MKNLAFSFGLMLAVSASGASAQTTYKYTLEGFPKDNTNCHLGAIEAGKVFAAANPEVKLLSAVCLEEHIDGYDFEIRYESTAKVKTVSTTANLPPLSGKGRFKTREACLDRIPRDVQTFESATGLKASFAFCYRESKYSHEPIPYALRIDGFGEAELTAHISDYAIFAMPESLTGEEYVNTLVGNLEKRGVVVSAVVSHSQLAMGSIAIHYYAKNRIYFHGDELTKVERSEQCAAQVEEAVNALGASANPPLLVYCARPRITDVSELTVVFAERPTFRSNQSVEKFRSHSECETARPEILKFYKETLQRPVLTGLCTRVTVGEHRIRLFEEELN